jgi:hypothetical protein
MNKASFWNITDMIKKVVWVLAIFVSIHAIKSVLVICDMTVTNET